LQSEAARPRIARGNFHPAVPEASLRAILTYHSIDDSGSVVSVNEGTFRRHAEFLSRAGLRSVGLLDLVAMPDDADAVAITFDDAFANFASAAWPVLRELGHRVTLFVPTAHVGRTNGWESGAGRMPVLPLLDWADLGRLTEEGVTIGAHSETHPDLTTLEPDTLHAEVARPVEQIHRETGVVPHTFAYPYGAVNKKTAAEVGKHYRLAVTTELRWLARADDVHWLPRLDAYYLRRPGALERFGSARFRRALRWRNRLRRARHRLTGGM
jgi:peptidoglycan/xylan/chitin deacetylase (PgdA/CDA1 family)